MPPHERIRFSEHAIDERMPERKITVRDVLATLAAPDYELPGNQPGTRESYGKTFDGRAFFVVTARQRTYVITVVELKES